MSNIPSDIDCNAIQSESVTASPVSKNSDDKELSWSNVEDTDDDTSLSSVAVEEPLVEPVAEPVVEPVAEPVVEPVAPVDPVEKCEEAEKLAEKLAEKPVEVQKFTVPPLTIDDTPLVSNESSDDDMPPLVSSDDESSDESSDDIPQLVESSDDTTDDETTDDETTDESDDEMPELVSDDDDIVHMMIRDTNCLRCHSAIQTLLSHDHDYLNGIEEECTTLRPKNEFPSIITYILWLFIALHALNLVSTYCGHPSC